MTPFIMSSVALTLATTAHFANHHIDVGKIIRVIDGIPNAFRVPSETIEGKYYDVNMDLML